ncbi:MAG: DUF1801 domain-containing protein [Chitinophagales bacterium]|nr:DUF1801 domain-containing protein [Chitinophagales bacterium]
MKSTNAIDEYILKFPSETQELLSEIRHIIQNAAPDAEEIISYGMPAYKQNNVLVYFAGNKNHIGFYPTASGIENFKEHFTDYKWSKGAVQFPLDQPLPEKLIKAIVKFRINEVQRKAKQSK